MGRHGGHPSTCSMGAAAPFAGRVSPVVPDGGLTSVSAQTSGATAPSARNLRIGNRFCTRGRNKEKGFASSAYSNLWLMVLKIDKEAAAIQPPVPYANQTSIVAPMAGRRSSRPALVKAAWAAAVSIWMGGKWWHLAGYQASYLKALLAIFLMRMSNFRRKKCFLLY